MTYITAQQFRQAVVEPECRKNYGADFNIMRVVAIHRESRVAFVERWFTSTIAKKAVIREYRVMCFKMNMHGAWRCEFNMIG